MNSIQQTERICRRLRIVRLFALVDLVLLIALIFAALTGQRAIVQILGPLHGINFLLLLVVVGVGALDGIWEWWFPIAVLLTAGPPGAFIGEWIINRRTGRQLALIHETDASETAMVATEGETDTSALPFPATLQEEGKKQI